MNKFLKMERKENMENIVTIIYNFRGGNLRTLNIILLATFSSTPPYYTLGQQPPPPSISSKSLNRLQGSDFAHFGKQWIRSILSNIIF